MDDTFVQWNVVVKFGTFFDVVKTDISDGICIEAAAIYKHRFLVTKGTEIEIPGTILRDQPKKGH